MESLNIEDELLRIIITEHLHLLEKSDFAQLSKVLGVSLEDIKTRIDIIKEFNPTPGVKYSEEKTQYIVPDIIVRKEDGELDDFDSFPGQDLHPGNCTITRLFKLH